MKIKLVIIAVLILSGFSANAQQFLPAEQAFVVESYQQSKDGSVEVTWAIAEGYYLYKSKLKALSNGNELSVTTPQGVTVNDVNFGKQEVFKEDFKMVVDGAAQGELVIKWQGCAEAGLCYPPETTNITLSESVTPAGKSEDLSFFETLSNSNTIVITGSFFAVGLLLAFTPCSLPMLPILANIVIGGKKRSALKLSGVYTISMAAMYSVAGVATAIVGSSLQGALQSPVTLSLFAVILLIFAASMLGLYELRLPQFVTSKLTAKSQSAKGGSVLGAAVLGIFSALIVGPCMTAPLAGALLFISETGNALTGGIALFALGIGMGLPLMLLSVAGRKALPKPGRWMNYIKNLLGVILVCTAVYFISKILELNVAILTGALALTVIGCLNLTLKRKSSDSLPFIASAIMISLSILMQHSEIAKETPKASYFTTVKSVESLQQQIDLAQESKEKVFIDVYADWCASCVVMDNEVFSSPEAKQALKDFRTIKVDVTEMNEQSEELLKELKVLGPPTLITLNKTGVEIREKRITGEVGLTEFLSAVRERKKTPRTPAELFESQSQL
jgi:thiol:disulfide interchange protein DsbD